MIKYNYSRNIWIVYAFNFLKGMMFFLPIYTLYLQHELFTALNVTIIIAIQTFCGMLFEVPTGAVADLFGRKNTLILSGIIALISLIFLSIGGSMLVFIIYAILSALSGSLLSGTDTAILFDTLKAVRREANFQKIMMWSIGSWQTGAAIGSLIGGVLASISLKVPIIYTFIPFTLALIITFFIIEPPYKKETHKNIFLHMRNTSKLLTKNGLMLLFIATVLLFAFSEVAFSFEPVFMDFKQIPIMYFGVILALSFFLGFVGSYLSSHYWNKKYGDKKVLLVSVIVTPLFTLLATFFNMWLTAICLIIASIFFSIRLPILMDLFNKNTPSKNRATMMSVVSFGSVLGMAIYAPFFGYIVDLFDINFAFQTSAILTVIAIIFVVLFKEKK